MEVYGIFLFFLSPSPYYLHLSLIKLFRYLSSFVCSVFKSRPRVTDRPGCESSDRSGIVAHLAKHTLKRTQTNTHMYPTLSGLEQRPPFQSLKTTRGLR